MWQEGWFSQSLEIKTAVNFGNCFNSYMFLIHFYIWKVIVAFPNPTTSQPRASAPIHKSLTILLPVTFPPGMHSEAPESFIQFIPLGTCHSPLHYYSLYTSLVFPIRLQTPRGHSKKSLRSTITHGTVPWLWGTLQILLE